MQAIGGRRRAILCGDGLWRVLALLLGAAGALVLLVAALTFPAGSAWGFDFQAYYEAAQRLVETGSPYRAQWLAGPFDLGPVAGLFVYSPLPALLVVPLTALDQPTAVVVWFVLRVSVLLATCLLMPVAPRVRLAVFGAGALSLPVLTDLALGNVSLIVTFLTVVAWRFLDRPVGALAVASTLFVRPTTGLFVAWWLVRRRLAPALVAVAGAGGIALASVLLIGLRPYLDYLTLLGNIGAVTGIPNNRDLASFVAGLGAPPAVIWLALVASFAVAGIAVLLSLRRDRELSFVVVAMATLLVSPLLWDHYLTNLVIPAALLAARGRAWGLALPLLCWLPAGLLGLVAVLGLLAPLAAPDRGEPALTGPLLRRPGQRS